MRLTPVYRIGRTVLLAAALAAAGTVLAVDWQVEPAYGLQFGYDDNHNLSFLSGNQQQVGIAKATANVSFSRRQPAHSADIDLQLDAISHSGDDAGLDDRLDGSMGFAWQQIGERSDFDLDLRYVSDSLLQSIQLSASPQQQVDQQRDVENGLVREDAGRTRLSIASSYRYQLSPIASATGALRLSQVEHENTPNTSLVNFEEGRLSLRYDRDFDPVNRWGADLELRTYEATNAEQNYDSTVFGLSVTHQFDETTDIGLRVAAATTDYDTTGLRRVRLPNGSSAERLVRTTGDNSSTLLQLFGSRSTGRARYAFRLGNDLYGSGSGDVVLAAELLANVVYQWDELTTLTWRNKLFENKSLNEVDSDNDGKADFLDSNRRYLALEPSVNWRFSRWWVLDVGYRYQREKRDSRPGSGTSNYAFVGVTYRKPLGLVAEPQ